MFTRCFFFVLAIFIHVQTVFSANTVIPKEDDSQYGWLGKKFIYGTLQLYDIPAYLKYLTEKLVWVAALLAVVVAIVGGYRYIVSGVTDDTEGAKNTLKNVLIGLVFVVFAWMIIDLVVRVISE